MRQHLPALRSIVKPKKSDHVSATGQPFHGTDAEFYLCNNLPYARWTLTDRREVLVNAFHEPLWVRGPGIEPTQMDPRETVTGLLWKDRIYTDAHRHHQRRELAKTWLDDFRNGLVITMHSRL